MRCPHCSTENKKTAKFCSDCGKPIATGVTTATAPVSAKDTAATRAQNEVLTPFWKPDWKWHAKCLAGIYLFLIALYFAISLFLSRVPAPYHMRDIPPEMTPWLKK